MYQLDFTKDSAGILTVTPEEAFSVCTQAVLTDPQKAAAPDAWDDVIGLTKKLKSIGKVANKLPNGRNLYELTPGGGSISLERGERAQLLDYIKAGQWIPDFLEKVKVTRDWIDALPEEMAVPKPSNNIPARSRPERVR